MKVVILALTAFINTTCFSQHTKFFIESAIRFTGDAEMAFIGPSFSAGPGVQIGNHLSISSTYTFFYDSYSSGSDKETFRTHTIDLLPIYHFNELDKSLRGFYMGIGLAWQNRKMTPESIMIERPSYITAVFNLGYQWPVKMNKIERGLALEWKAIGPYKETYDNGGYLEQFTQFMIGVRLRY